MFLCTSKNGRWSVCTKKEQEKLMSWQKAARTKQSQITSLSLTSTTTMSAPAVDFSNLPPETLRTLLENELRKNQALEEAVQERDQDNARLRNSLDNREERPRLGRCNIRLADLEGEDRQNLHSIRNLVKWTYSPFVKFLDVKDWGKWTPENPTSFTGRLARKIVIPHDQDPKAYWEEGMGAGITNKVLIEVKADWSTKLKKAYLGEQRRCLVRLGGILLTAIFLLLLSSQARKAGA